MKTNLINPKSLVSTFLIMGMLLSLPVSFAQQPDTVEAGKAEGQKPQFPKNNVKINLSSLAFKNYSFYFERSLSRKISFSLGYRTMPSTNLGELSIVKKLNDKLNQGDEILGGINRMQAGGNAYTGEFRFYGGKKPGARGVYLSLYGRYARFDHDYDYQFSNTHGDVTAIPINSKVNGFGGGLMLGKQWLIGKRINLDVYYLGGHFGKLTGKSKGLTDLSSLSSEDKADLKAKLDNTLVIKEKHLLNSNVTNQGITGKIDGPFAGLRSFSFSLGIAF